MAQHKLVRSNYGGKSPVSPKYENLHSVKEGVILICQSILEIRRMSHLHGSPLFTIPSETDEENLCTFKIKFYRCLKFG